MTKQTEVTRKPRKAKEPKWYRVETGDDPGFRIVQAWTPEGAAFRCVDVTEAGPADFAQAGKEGVALEGATGSAAA